MDEAQIVCEEASLMRDIAKMLMNVERSRLLLNDATKRLNYLRSITPESLIQRANSGDLASE